MATRLARIAPDSAAVARSSTAAHLVPGLSSGAFGERLLVVCADGIGRSAGTCTSLTPAVRWRRGWMHHGVRSGRWWRPPVMTMRWHARQRGCRQPGRRHGRGRDPSDHILSIHRRRLTLGGPIEEAGCGSPDVQQDEADRPPDRGVGSNARTERSVANVDTDLRSAWPVDDAAANKGGSSPARRRG